MMTWMLPLTFNDFQSSLKTCCKKKASLFNQIKNSTEPKKSESAHMRSCPDDFSPPKKNRKHIFISSNFFFGTAEGSMGLSREGKKNIKKWFHPKTIMFFKFGVFWI